MLDSGNKSKLNKGMLFALVVATIIGIAVRICMFDFETSDYKIFLVQWMNSLAEAGGIKGIGLNLGDYTCPYIYILTIITLLPVNRLYAIKVVSCVFDFALAFLGYRIIDTMTGDKRKSVFAYIAVFLCPTVIVNSALWAQCDSIFTAFIFASLLYILKDKPVKSCIFYGIAFALKLQSIFFAPIFICLWLKKRVKIKHLLCVPAVYVAFCIPAIAMGRDVFSTFAVYLHQGAKYPQLSLNAASLLGFTQDIGFDYSNIVLLLTIGLAGAFVLLLIVDILREKNEITNIRWLDLACLFIIAIPFLLPKMHERYFYIADAMTIVYAFIHRKRWFVPILTVFGSFYTYLRFLYSDIFGKIPLFIASLAMGAAAVLIFVYYYRDYIKQQRIKSVMMRF